MIDFSLFKIVMKSYSCISTRSSVGSTYVFTSLILLAHLINNVFLGAIIKSTPVLVIGPEAFLVLSIVLPHNVLVLRHPELVPHYVQRTLQKSTIQAIYRQLRSFLAIYEICLFIIVKRYLETKNGYFWSNYL